MVYNEQKQILSDTEHKIKKLVDSICELEDKISLLHLELDFRNIFQIEANYIEGNTNILYDDLSISLQKLRDKRRLLCSLMRLLEEI